MQCAVFNSHYIVAVVNIGQQRLIEALAAVLK